MKNTLKIIFVLLFIVTLVFSLSSCLEGLDFGNNSGEKDNEEEDITGGEVTVVTPEELIGQSVVSAILYSNGDIIVVTNKNKVKIGTLSYENGGEYNITYDESLTDALGITGFEPIGKNGLTIIVGEARFDCSGTFVCSHEYGEWKITGETCAEDICERSCTLCGESEKKYEPKEGETEAHDIVNHEAQAPDCRNVGWEAYVTCSKCSYTTYKELAVTDHNEVIDEGYPATETEYGLTDGSHCSYCFTVIIAQHRILPTGFGNLDNYAGSYGYEYLATMENGEALQSFYNEIDSVADAFHTSNIDLEDKTVAEITFSDNGLDSAEALAVYTTYKNDNPLYYWIGSAVSYTPTTLYLQTDDEYRSAAARASYNDKVYNTVLDYAVLLENYESDYYLTLLLHDLIIERMDYAYEADGVTPSNDASAHNILGAVIFGKGVCESYARTFQLVLNFFNVDNIFVSGYSRGEAHAWNLVKLDDGEYYWYDLTWDDTPEYMLGISYNYFATDDDSVLTWRDYGWSVSEQKSFMSSHTPTYPGAINTPEEGLSFLYGLPKRAEDPMPLSSLRIKFTLEGIGYVRVSYNSVQVVSVPEGDVVIPERVVYNNREYTVVGIGSVGSDGLMTRESVGGGMTSIHLPNTVEYVSDCALECSTLKSITVDEGSRYFTSLDGVLYTKNMITLVKYPEAKEGSVYEIPDSVLYAAHGSLFYLRKTELIRVGVNLKCFGYTYLGYAFADTMDGAANNYIFDNEMTNILNTMYRRGDIVIDENNPYIN